MGRNQRSKRAAARAAYEMEMHDFEKPPVKTPISCFKLKEARGDLATIGAQDAVLIHACDCFGQWGTGVATALARTCPELVHTCQEYIRKSSTEALLGTCVMIWAEDKKLNRKWVACLFTSEGYGKRTKDHRGKSSVADITKYTRLALQDLRDQLEY